MVEELFGQALCIEEPWEVTSVIFDRPIGEVVITVDLAAGSRFAVAGEVYRH